MNPWIQLIDGKKVDLIEPHIDSIDIETIALALARTPRFGGHFKKSVEWYSVAQHSVLVSELVPEPFRLAGLLHDAHEALWGFGDVCRPAKRMDEDLCTFFKRQANVFDVVIAEKFGTYAHMFSHPYVKDADNYALATEQRDLMEDSVEEWFELPKCDKITVIVPLSIKESYELFMYTFQQVKE